MNANMNGGTVGLLTLYTLHMDDKLASVAFKYFAGLLALVVAASDHDLVVLADRYAAYAVLFAQLFAERRAHDLSSDVRRRGKVSLSVFSSGRCDQLVELHFWRCFGFLFLKVKSLLKE